MAGELSRARLLYGTTEGGGSPGSDTFTALDGGVNLSGPDGQNAEIEVTELLSTGKEYIPDLPDFGSISLTVNRRFSNASQNAIEQLFFGRNTRNWRIEFLDGSDTVLRTADFRGFVSQFSNSEDQGSARTSEISIRISGSVTLS